MTTGIKTIIYPVGDISRAKALFQALLDAEPVMDEPYYVGFQVADQDIGLDPHGHSKGMTGPLSYWHVDDINAHLQQLVDAGAEVRQPVSDVGGGKLIATVADTDGNVIGLLQAP